MAKAYITASKRKGSVGGETYSVVKGQTIVKAKPVQVANPRTSAQMGQRSLFIDAVRFYQHSNQAYFKLAFEDKKATESDYNAFMRSNAALGVHITKAMSDSPIFPAIGNWVASKGSLPSLTISYASRKWDIALPGLEGTETTMGQLSASLKSNYGVKENDIITLVSVVSYLTNVNDETLEPSYADRKAPKWNILQFKINSNSSVLISTALPGFSVVTNALSFADDLHSTCCAFFGVISRATSTGLKVSNSSMVANEKTSQIIEQMSDPVFIEKVLASWDTSSEAILQGGMS